MEHRRLAGRAVDGVGLDSVLVIEHSHIDLDLSQSLFGWWCGDGLVDGLAPDDEDLIDSEDTSGGSNGVIELVAIHAPRSSERNSA